jgi:hypothetical protein
MSRNSHNIEASLIANISGMMVFHSRDTVVKACERFQK